MFRNGGFLYIDLENIIETATPECRNHHELLRYSKAMELYMYYGFLELKKLKKEVKCWKLTTFKGGTRGAHESYDTDRLSFYPNRELLIPYLCFRQLFTGSGGYYKDKFVISPKTMFVEKDISSQWSHRPILSTRDTKGGAYRRYRFHQTFGDALRTEIPTLLKFGITSYMIAAVEEGLVKKVPKILQPVLAVRTISENLSGPWRVESKEGKRIDVVEYLCSDVMGVIERLFGARVPQDHDRFTLKKLDFVLQKLSAGSIEGLRNDLEWAMKLYILERYLDRFKYPYKGKKFEQEKRKDLAVRFTDITDDDVWSLIEIGLSPGPQESLKPIIPTKILSKEEIKKAVLCPPRNSRAEFRVRLAKRYESRLFKLDWDCTERTSSSGAYNFKELNGWDEKKYKKCLEDLER
jgi:proteasome accessory factor A